MNIQINLQNLQSLQNFQNYQTSRKFGLPQNNQLKIILFRIELQLSGDLG